MDTASEKKSRVRSLGGIFWNYSERRPRATWRLTATVIFTAILTFIFGFPFVATGGGFPAPYVEKLVLYVGALVAIVIAARKLDRRPFSDTGIYFRRAWWIELGFGLLLGAFLMTLVFLVELSAGWITISEFFVTADKTQPFLVAITFPVLLNLIVGVVEELMFRGYLLLNLAEGFNGPSVNPRVSVMIAWVLTSAVFGVAHALLPNATVVSTINIVLAGIWLGLAYVFTGSLAASIGVHITWNLFQGYIFGFPVSGGRDFATTVISIQQGGPDIWTGGAFGPEGGLLGLLGFGLGIVLMAAWVRRRHGHLTVHSSIANPPSVG